MENRELGIYIHIPFCQHKCDYCDFISFSNKQDFIEHYVETVKKEINNYFEDKILLETYTITTIYIGGGTPSYIDSKYICEIMEVLENNLKQNKVKFEDMEITIEVNPGTVTKKKLEQYRKAKINRLSIGLQSTNNEMLKQIGRIHTYEQFLETYKIAKEVGFENINVDLMIGLPNQTIEDIKRSLKEIVQLNPTHISVYSLIIEEGTVIARKIENHQLQEMDEELERNMYWYVKNTLELNGYTHYEISNFAKEEKESKHNMNCWRQKEYIGIGLAAHSYLNYVRYTNTSEREQYITRTNNRNTDLVKDILELAQNDEKLNLEENIENVELSNNNKKTNLKEKEKYIEMIYEIEEVQDVESRKKEYMLLGLRTIEGVSISKFKEKYIDNPIFLFRKELEKLVEEKLVVIDGDYIKLTNKGLDLANLVWEEFI